MTSSRRSIPRRENATKRFIVSLSMILLFTAQYVHGYVDWLKCYIEFDDPEEVIMHHSIVPSEQQSEQEQVYIEVQPYASRRRDPWLASNHQNHEDLFPPSIYNATMTTLIKLRLKVSLKLQDKDVQFVVEATGEGISFVGPGVMCDGKRAFSRQHDKSVLLEMKTTVAVAEKLADADKERWSESSSSLRRLGDIELVAGWAAGYEAVKLTPKMIVRRNNLGNEMTTTNGSAAAAMNNNNNTDNNPRGSSSEKKGDDNDDGDSEL